MAVGSCFMAILTSSFIIVSFKYGTAVVGSNGGSMCAGAHGDMHMAGFLMKSVADVIS